MEKAKDVGAYLFKEYPVKYTGAMDELKMHKLMYLAQRESLMMKGEPLFDEDFYGWKYGPVLKSVRTEFHRDKPYSDATNSLSVDDKKLVDDVMARYGGLSSWRLSSLSHDEFSWKKARKGLNAGENGNTRLDLKAMKVDAAREKAFRRRMLKYNELL